MRTEKAKSLQDHIDAVKSAARSAIEKRDKKARKSLEHSLRCVESEAIQAQALRRMNEGQACLIASLEDQLRQKGDAFVPPTKKYVQVTLMGESPIVGEIKREKGKSYLVCPGEIIELDMRKVESIVAVGEGR